MTTTYVPPLAISDKALRQELIVEQLKRCPVVGNPVRAWHAVITVRSLRKGYSSMTFDDTVTAYVVTAGLLVPQGLDDNMSHLIAQVDNNWRIIPHTEIFQIEPYVDREAEARQAEEAANAAEVERIKQKLAVAQKPAAKAPAKKRTTKAKVPA